MIRNVYKTLMMGGVTQLAISVLYNQYSVVNLPTWNRSNRPVSIIDFIRSEPEMSSYTNLNKKLRELS